MALARVRDRLHDALAQHRRAAEHAVQPRVGGHLDDGGNAAAFVAEHDAPRVVQLDLAARIAAVADLVLQPLDLDRVLRAVRAPARHVEARRAAGLGARDDEVRVAHRRGEEPLVAAQPVFAAAPARADRRRERRVRAHVGAALFLGHAHAEPDRALVGDRHVARIVVVAVELVAQQVPQRRLLLQHGDRGLRHRRGAQRAGLDLAVQVEAGGRRGPAAAACIAECKRHEAFVAILAEQRVPRRVEVDAVDAPAAPVERVQLRRVAVRFVGEPRGVGAAEPRTVRIELRHGPVGARPGERVAQREIRREEVIVDEFVELVRDGVGRVGHRGCLRSQASRSAGVMPHGARFGAGSGFR